MDPSPDPDPCVATPVALALGTTVTGVLDAATDCFDHRDGRLGDAYLLELVGARVFTVTLTAEGFLPFVPVYRGVDQLSGWASDSLPTLTREHLLPAGGYSVRASSYGRAATATAAPQGRYTLSTIAVDLPQEGCGRETSITYGSVAEGRITTGDCVRTPADEPESPRLADGYAAILAVGRPMTAVVRAGFPFRLVHLADGAPAAATAWLPPGAEASLTASGAGFHDFYVLAADEAVLGPYRASFVEASAASAAGEGGGGAPPP